MVSAPIRPSLLCPQWLLRMEDPVRVETGMALLYNAQGRITRIDHAATLRAEVVQGLWGEVEIVDLPQHVLMPGLINTHSHAAMHLLRGLADDKPLMTWLQQHIWPAEAQLVSPAFVHDGTLLACAEMLCGGITCSNDMYFYPEAMAQAVERSGMRAMVGAAILEFPTRYASDVDHYLQHALSAVHAWQNHDRVRMALAPHAPYTVSDATFTRINALAHELDLPVHIHVHETQDEIQQSLAQYQQRPLARLQALGVLGPHVLMAHGVHVNREELSMLKTHAVALAHNPSSNLKLGSGIAPISDYLHHGVVVGLGTDGAASNNRQDIWTEMRLAALLAKGSTGRPEQVPAAQALLMATRMGAQALGWADDIGSLSPGKWADCIAVDLSAPECQPCFDVLSHLVYVCGREHVSHVWVAGQACVWERQLLSMNAAELQAKIQQWQPRVQPFAASAAPASSG